MLDVVWFVVVIVVLSIVALLFVADALDERTLLGRLGGLMVIATGLAMGFDVAAPWLPLGLGAVAIALIVGGCRAERLTE